MLSVIRPSSSLCLQQPTSTSSSSSSSSPSSSSSTTTTTTSTYKDVVAHLAAKAPQPYGSIPRRRKTAPSRPRASSTSSLSSLSSSSSSSSPASSSSSSSSHKSRLRITTSSIPALTSASSSSTSSVATSSLWATIRAQYLSWSLFSGVSTSTSTSLSISAPTSPTGGLLPLSPVTAPVAVASMAEALQSVATTLDLDLQSLSTTAPFPASVAAMDKFKPRLCFDTIPLKTFTYRETPVPEAKLPRMTGTRRSTSSSVPKMTRTTSSLSLTTSTTETATASSSSSTTTTTATDKNSTAMEEDECPLPRHLASRETRSNTDYLRMMATELQMIRARKLIAPLKPRGYLPRRRDAFQLVKSSLCTCTSASMEMASVEEDHPLNHLFVGSWSSLSSTDSYLSTDSSDYMTAHEAFD
ncbi:hypothetical protein BGZ94_001852 [Podila epigama]|nr:hypothetical protein BGZ94_001852 [Podila epigama]